ncbi:MAG: phosphopyruvate hydratase [Alphaproteobacteria bacterium]|nr:phosphopyruvate hydratase [Alphaproteobacteria bacterium]
MSASRIERVVGRQVWDSRGRPTVEVEVALSGGARGTAIAPAGASTGSGEALDLRDGGKTLGGYGVARAIENVNGPISQAIVGREATDQTAIDRILIELDGTTNKSRLGGNATVATSMAIAQAAAAADGVPLWRYLRGDAHAIMPLPQIQIFGGGAHAARRVDLQDFMIVALGARTFAEALRMTAEVYLAAGQLMAERGALQGVADEGGFWPAFAGNDDALKTLVRAIENAGFEPGVDIAIALDIAATQFYRDGRYHFDRQILESDALGDLLLGWLDRYPIISIEDPLAEHDVAGFKRFTAAARDRVQIVGDDFLVTNAERVGAAVGNGACNAVLIKPNQAGTLTEAKAAFDAARVAGWNTIVSARSGETEDVTIVHLAVGWGAPELKVGSFARSERMAKWNEGLRIEEALGRRAALARPFERFGRRL